MPKLIRQQRIDFSDNELNFSDSELNLANFEYIFPLGETGKWRNGETGKRRNGETGKRGNGETGKRGNGRTGNGNAKFNVRNINKMTIRPCFCFCGH